MIPVDGDNQITETWLRHTLETYRSTDDVFHDDFLGGVIFTGATDGPSLEVTPAAKRLLDSLGNKWVEVLGKNGVDDKLPPGPYLVVKQLLLDISRLYDDFQGAFMTGLIPLRYR